MIRPHSLLALGSFSCMGLSSLTTVAYAWLAGPILRMVQSPHDAPSPPGLLAGWFPNDASAMIATMAASVLAVTVARGVAAYGQRMLSVRLGQRIVRELRERMYEHLLGASSDVLLSRRRGELASRIGTETLQVQSLLATNLGSVIADLLTLGGLGTLAFSLDASLAGVALAGVPPIALIVWQLARKVRASNRRVWAQYSELASQAAELADVVPMLRAYGAERHAKATFEAQSQELERRVLSAQRWSAFAGPTVQLLGGIALVVTLFYAAPRLVAGDLEPERFISFFAAVLFLYRPVQGIGATVQRVAAGLSALDRVDEVLGLESEPPDPPGAEDLPRFSDVLRLRGVSFAYRPDEPVLEGVDLELRPGESVAIVGASGEGKTTLLRILLGLTWPTGGEISMDGRSAAGVTRRSWRANFSWVAQEPLIFADTILANVTLSDSPPSDPERARQALSMAGALAFVDGLERGLDTLLSEGGKELSGGQRQRLCIARALYRDAPVLVFDEATSSLDGPSEHAIAETIEELMEERTVVLVSHRLSTVARADRVVVLDAGRVIERGSPRTLWETDGRFRRLFRDATLQ